MSIVDFFDVHNTEHIKAYKVLMQTGRWPYGFAPEGTEFPPAWQIAIANKLANTYIEIFLQYDEVRKKVIKYNEKRS
jgi:hypothetical protein